MWVPAHGDGIAPNAYADCIAKNCLAESPSARAGSRSPVLLQDAAARRRRAQGECTERVWRNLADMSVHRLMLSRMTAVKGARDRGMMMTRRSVDVFACETSILRAALRGDGAGNARHLSDAGRAHALRSDSVSMPADRNDEDDGCMMCGATTVVNGAGCTRSSART